MSTTDVASFAPGEDGPHTLSLLTPLLRSNGGRWQLTDTGNGLERNFRFKTFKKTWVG